MAEFTDRRRHLGVSLVVFALIVGFLFWARTLEPAGRLFPMLVGWMGLVLCALDVLAHTPTRIGTWVGMVLSGSAHFDAGKQEEEKVSPWREATACLWMLAGLALIVFLGFMIAVPIFIVTYMMIRGRRSLRQSLVSALLTSLFIWLIFSVLLEYELYPGILFGGYAFGLS